MEVLEDIDWCLEQLEAVQTHRSLSELASSKVRACLCLRLPSCLCLTSASAFAFLRL